MKPTGSQQAQRLVQVIRDAERGWPELAKRNPKLAEEFRRQQHEVARAGSRDVPESLRSMRFG